MPSSATNLLPYPNLSNDEEKVINPKVIKEPQNKERVIENKVKVIKKVEKVSKLKKLLSSRIQDKPILKKQPQATIVLKNNSNSRSNYFKQEWAGASWI